MKKILFKIITPEKTAFTDEVDSVSLMTQMGEITVLANHIPLIGILLPGEIKVKKGSEDHFLSVTGGYVEVHTENKVTVLADAAERVEEIDIERAEKARERAEKMIKEKGFADDIEFAALQSALERSLSRIRIAKKRSRRKR